MRKSISRLAASIGLGASLVVGSLALPTAAHAEGKIRVAEQFGIVYLLLNVVRDQHLIETSTTLMVFTILIVVYRSLVAMLLPLVTIGVSLVVAQQLVAGLGLLGLGLTPQTIVLMTGMMLGAGTDYAIFLFSRYQEFIRAGQDSDHALISALTSIGEVIAGSAGTVAITFLALSFATLGVFATIGPALAVTVLSDW